MEETISIKLRRRFLHGILHAPDTYGSKKTIVIMINGGPQTRVGSHRLYTQLARYLCRLNFIVLRFDYEGLGDSDGDFSGFRFSAPSIEAVLRYANSRFGRETKKVLWAICDGATASILYGAQHDEAVSGIIVCNPYISDESSSARVKMKHYYLKRMFDRSFWMRLISKDFQPFESLKNFIISMIHGYGYSSIKPGLLKSRARLGDEIMECLQKFKGQIGVILSTTDLVASEFNDLFIYWMKKKKFYNIDAITVEYIQNASHTFMDPADKKKMFDTTFKMISSWQEI